MGKVTRPARKGVKKATSEKAVVENVNHPGKTERVDAKKYMLARAAMLQLLPTRAPGMTQHEMMTAMRDALSVEVFPGTTTTWWTKTVQLDLEAKGLVVRDAGKPLRWRRAHGRR